MINKNRFAFIAHPITPTHLCHIVGGLGGIALGRLSNSALKGIMSNSPPIRLGVCKNVKSKLGMNIEGIGVICPLLPDQFISMSKDFVMSKIMEAINVAKKYEAKIVTLGGFVSIVGDEGMELSKTVDGIAITTGNTCTAALVIEGIIKASSMLNLDLKTSTMAIIGATGDIGSICSQIFSKKVKSLNIVARKQQYLKEFSEAIKNHSNAEIRIFQYTSEAIKNADIVLTTTSSLTTLIEPKALKTKAIVCDVSIPPNISKEIVNVREDILVFEGGLAKLPYHNKIDGKKWNKFIPGSRIYGCLTEAILLTFEKRFENYSIGRGHITEDKVQEMIGLMKKHSIEVSDFYCGNKHFTIQEIEKIKNIDGLRIANKMGA